MPLRNVLTCHLCFAQLLVKKSSKKEAKKKIKGYKSVFGYYFNKQGENNFNIKKIVVKIRLLLVPI